MSPLEIKLPKKATLPVDHQSDFGEVLKSAREKKKLSLTTAEHDTKIRLHYLEAMEQGRFDLIPPSHSKGLVRRYGNYLAIPPDVVNQNIEYLSSDRPKKQPFTPHMLKRETRVLLTPKTVAGVLSVIVLSAFIGYIVYQVKQFAAPPVLTITKPSGESVVTQESMAVEGQTDPGATVYIDNGAATTSSDGKFSYTITLRPGLNQITVRAENRIKKSSSSVLSVLYQPATAQAMDSLPSPSPEATPLPSPSPTPTPEPSVTPAQQANKPASKPVTKSTVSPSPSIDPLSQ